MTGPRVVVFIDYQNTYKSARRVYGLEDDNAYEGQFFPTTLARKICGRIPEAQLSSTRVYRGRPSNKRDPRTYAAYQRQRAAWEKAGVVVESRDLRYPRDWPDMPAQEKGVDVALAIDFVAMAIRNEYDIGVLFSRDTDMKPAVEAVLDLPGTAQPQVAAWQPLHGMGSPLRFPGRAVFCHYLTAHDYDDVADLTDYNRK